MEFQTFITNRLQEKSTWVGLTILIASIGIVLSPELKDSIILMGMGFGGIVFALSKEK